MTKDTSYVTKDEIHSYCSKETPSARTVMSLPQIKVLLVLQYTQSMHLRGISRRFALSHEYL